MNRRWTVYLSIGLSSNIGVNKYNNLRISAFDHQEKYLRVVGVKGSPGALSQVNSGGDRGLRQFREDKRVFLIQRRKFSLFGLIRNWKKIQFYESGTDPRLIETEKKLDFSNEFFFELEYLLIDNQTMAILFRRS